MSKKYGIIPLLLLLFLGLVACGSDDSASDSTSGGKKGNIEVEIENASYILAGEGGTSNNENAGMLAVEFAVTNNNEYPITISSYDGIKLDDEGEQKNPQTDLYNSKVDLESTFSGDIGAEKMAKITSIFYVEKDKEYEVRMIPFSTNPEADVEDVTVALDTAEFSDSFDALNEPEEALLAYIDTIYLDQENDDYERLVSADKEALQDEAKKLFAEKMQSPFMMDVPEEEIDKNYETYKSLLTDKVEITAETIANANNKAVVNVDYSTLPLDLYDPVSDYADEYREKKDDYDRDAMEEYALSNFDKILNDIEPKSARETLEILMVKEDGHWSVDTSDWNSERLAEAFSTGS
ncbi:DUF5105 domain-containing protein [Oceanobacillus sp. J11TS1]|uniref:DUF5105 domain-containing protein n=1 Tax=Oceanobacillus sp. J11TS1 TaxID=2807191 RepID=UPI001B0D9BE0|nr:DUF5105 domain-containing protein [Oceanobacillus sp. J11TS1]GIO22180.1 hypothetical protein J11TS1_07610 [Oceanobacillus sp. J11TS1]